MEKLTNQDHIDLWKKCRIGVYIICFIGLIIASILKDPHQATSSAGAGGIVFNFFLSRWYLKNRIQSGKNIGQPLLIGIAVSSVILIIQIIISIVVFGFLITPSESSAIENKTNQVGWTKQFENEYKNKLVNLKEFESLSLAFRQKLADCALEKSKEKFPNGIIGKPDSILLKLGSDVGTLCIEEISKNTSINGWTIKREQEFFNQLMSDPELAAIDRMKREKYINCLIEEYKKACPSSIINILPKETVEKLSEKCAKDVFSKK